MGLFIFNRALISSRSAKDGAADIDLFAAPVQNLANVTSTEGLVTLYFKDGNSFTALTGGTTNVRGYEYAQVELSVNVGDEQFVVRELGRLLSQIQKGERTTITIDVPQETYSILGVTGINSIKRFNDLTTLTTDPASTIPPNGLTDQVLTKASDTNGDVEWSYVDTLYITVRNTAGVDLDKGTPVHATGVTGSTPDVIVADASSAAAMPATYVLNEDILSGDSGLAIITGLIEGVDTSSFSPGDVVYVASGGGFTNVKPTGTNLIQNLGVVTKSNANTGSGVVYGAGRSNDVPNLPAGKFFIGSATNTAESAYTLPTADGSANQVLTTDGLGAVTFQDAASGGLSNVVEDTTPQLGGDLDVNGNAIKGSSVSILGATGELMITATENGPVALRYDNNLKLSTKSDGVNITGELEADSLDIDGNADISGTLNTHTIPSGTGTIALTSDITGIDDVVDDTTPQLGGDLDAQSNNITNLGSLNGTAASKIISRSLTVACSDETSDLTTGTAKATFRMPEAATITAVRASVTTAPAGSVLTVDINEAGTSILSTKLTIDAGEKTSTTAATPAVISDTSVADDAEMTVDIDGVGSSTAGAGLKVTIYYTPA